MIRLILLVKNPRCLAYDFVNDTHESVECDKQKLQFFAFPNISQRSSF